MSRMAKIFMVVWGLLLCAPAFAQNEYEISFGDYIVNYNTFPSTFLEPALSKAAGIKQSESRGVITIAIRARSTAGEIKGVKADVTGMVKNSVGQLQKLKLSEVKDGPSIYYIGDFAVLGNELMQFDVSLQPAGEKQQHEFKFSRQF